MIASFVPFVNAQTHTLILGTMPGIASLEKQEYYANKRNHFWTILFTILDHFPTTEVFEEKINILQENNIGLWDVLKTCERAGSLDVNIKNHEVNDFNALFKKFPFITTIIFNGIESHKYFFKTFGEIKGITYYVMPSTSPANTMSFENKLKLWSAAFKVL